MVKIHPKNDPRLNVQEPPCAGCKHLQTTGSQALEGWTCPAFPNGILYSILTRVQDHLTVLRGVQEGDAVYEPAKQYDFDDGRNWQTFDGEWVTEKEAKGN